jgi:hypothetical protein
MTTVLQEQCRFMSESHALTPEFEALDWFARAQIVHQVAEMRIRESAAALGLPITASGSGNWREAVQLAEALAVDPPSSPIEAMREAGVPLRGDNPAPPPEVPAGQVAKLREAEAALADAGVPLIGRVAHSDDGDDWDALTPEARTIKLREAGIPIREAIEGADSASPTIDRAPCPTCDGSGIDGGQACATCGGSGVPPDGESASSLSGARRRKPGRQRIGDADVVGDRRADEDGGVPTRESSRRALADVGFQSYKDPLPEPSVEDDAPVSMEAALREAGVPVR